MTDREFRRLRRRELVEIIDQLQANVDLYKRENTVLRERLAERRLVSEQAGSIAEAALRINEVFRAAQQAADDYLAELERRTAEAKTQDSLPIVSGQA